MSYAHLTDDELLRIAQAEHDPLTGTPLEAELIKRMGPLLDAAVTNQALIDVLDEFDVTKADDLRALLERIGFAELCEIVARLAKADLTTPALVSSAIKLYETACEVL